MLVCDVAHCIHRLLSEEQYAQSSCWLSCLSLHVSALLVFLSVFWLFTLRLPWVGMIVLFDVHRAVKACLWFMPSKAVLFVVTSDSVTWHRADWCYVCVHLAGMLKHGQTYAIWRRVLLH